MKKHRLWTTVSTSHELTAITYNSYWCTVIKDFWALLLGWIRWYPGFNCWSLPSPKIRHVQKLRIFFECAIVYPLYFNWKICIVLLCLVFADQRWKKSMLITAHHRWSQCTWVSQLTCVKHGSHTRLLGLPLTTLWTLTTSMLWWASLCWWWCPLCNRESNDRLLTPH